MLCAPCAASKVRLGIWTVAVFRGAKNQHLSVVEALTHLMVGQCRLPSPTNARSSNQKLHTAQAKSVAQQADGKTLQAMAMRSCSLLRTTKPHHNGLVASPPCADAQATWAACVAVGTQRSFVFVQTICRCVHIKLELNHLNHHRASVHMPCIALLCATVTKASWILTASMSVQQQELCHFNVLPRTNQPHSQNAHPEARASAWLTSTRRTHHVACQVAGRSAERRPLVICAWQTKHIEAAPRLAIGGALCAMHEAPELQVALAAH